MLYLKYLISVFVAAVITVTIFVGFWEWRNKHKKRPTKQELISLSAIPPNLIMYLITAPFWASIYLAVSQYAWFEIKTIWVVMPLLLLLCDLSYYIEHRIGHQWPFIWKLYHGTHHTGTEYNIPLAFRVNCLNMLVAPMFYLPWVLVGFEPLLVVGFQLMVFHYQGWLHTELIHDTRFDPWFNTPANHRMHHSQSHQGNFGGVLMVWDKLFGTYIKPESEVNYGIKGFSSDHPYVGLYLDFWKRKKINQNLVFDNKEK